MRVIQTQGQIPLFPAERRLSESGRSILLGGPGGYLTVVPADTLWTVPYGGHHYAGWVRLMSIKRPLTAAVAERAKLWAIRTFGRAV